MKTATLLLLVASVAVASPFENVKRQAASQIADGQVQAPTAATGMQPLAPPPASSAPAPGPSPSPSSSPAPAPPAPGTITVQETTLITTTVCASSGTPAPPPPPPATTPCPSPDTPEASSVPATPASPRSEAPASSPSCPLYLDGEFQFPHLMVPVNVSAPEVGGNSSYDVSTMRGIETIITFDIPASYAGKMCDTVFTLPANGTMESSSYRLSGVGKLAFTELNGPAFQGMSYNTRPRLGGYAVDWKPRPGTAVTIKSSFCPAGEQITFALAGNGHIRFNYFQDYNPCALGMYVIPR